MSNPFLNTVSLVAAMAMVTPAFCQEPVTAMMGDEAFLYETPADVPPMIDEGIAYEIPANCDNCGTAGYSSNGCQNTQCCNNTSFKYRHQEKWWGFPDEFCELPLGSSLNSILQLQTVRGEEARLTLYDYDFVPGTTSLNAHGRARLISLAKLAERWGGTIKIEPRDVQLDGGRLMYVQTMANEIPGLHPDQVVLATPIAAGLNGEEATLIRENHRLHIINYGVRQFDYGSFSVGSTGGNSR